VASGFIAGTAPVIDLRQICKLCSVVKTLAVDDQSEISFSIPRGQQPILSLSIELSPGDIRPMALAYGKIRWTQAASGAAGRAKRWALPCVEFLVF